MFNFKSKLKLISLQNKKLFRIDIKQIKKNETIKFTEKKSIHFPQYSFEFEYLCKNIFENQNQLRNIIHLLLLLTP